jgi:hypothetical protein
VVRTFRVKVMATPAKKARAYSLLVSGGDTWAWCIDRFHARLRDGLPNANSLVQMWPDQKGHGAFGELSVHCAQDVTKAWSAAFFETMKRRKKGEQTRLPLRKKWLVPVTWRKGEFALSAASEGRRPRAVLSTARGYASLELALPVTGAVLDALMVHPATRHSEADGDQGRQHHQVDDGDGSSVSSRFLIETRKM